jgi:OmpA-OmpF porin, OOP family
MQRNIIMNSKPVVRVLAFILVAGGLAAGTASAAESGAYVGAGVGATHDEDSINGVSGQGNAVSGKLYGGYQFNRYAGIEGGYTDLGHINNSTGTINGRAAYLDAVGTLPLTDKFSLLGSVGVAHANLDTSNGDDSGNGLKLGVGAQYALTDNVALRAQAERYRVDAFGAKPDIDQYTVGVRYAF